MAAIAAPASGVRLASAETEIDDPEAIVNAPVGSSTPLRLGGMPAIDLVPEGEPPREIHIDSSGLLPLPIDPTPNHGAEKRLKLKLNTSEDANKNEKGSAATSSGAGVWRAR